MTLPAKPCEKCGTPSITTICTGCRIRKCRGTLIDGQMCAIANCGIDHPRVLRWHRFTDATVALCANHDALAGRRPLAWAAFKKESRRGDMLVWKKTA